MDTPTLVTNVLLYQENLPSATEGDFVTARKRVKRNAQRIVDWVTLQRPWRWKFRTNVLPLAGGEGDLAALDSFSRLGRFGGVFPLTGKPSLRWIPYARFNDIRFQLPSSGDGRIYTIGEDKKLLTWPPGSGSVTVAYERRTPQLNDDTVGIDDPDADELFLIPDDYHEAVIYEGTVWYQMKDKANQQSVTEQKAIFMAGFKAMVESERPGMEAAHNVVPYGTGRR